MKVCVNCGGSFDEKETKCPYCGSLNIEAAEKEYMGKLETVRKDLDVVDDEAKEQYKSELKLFFKAFLSAIVVVGIIALIVLTSMRTTKTTGNVSAGRVAVDKKIDSIVALHEATVKWNSMFDEGKYDEMCAQVQEEYSKYSSEIYNWEHYYFYNAYKALMSAEESVEVIVGEDYSGTYYITNALQNVYVAYYNTKHSSYHEYYSETEANVLNDRLDIVVEEVCELLDISDSEFEALRIRAGADTYPSRPVVDDFVKERWGE